MNQGSVTVMSGRRIDIGDLLRPAIRNMKPYSSARSEFSGSAEIYLDANENFQEFVTDAGQIVDGAHTDALNRYPDPLQRELKREVARVFGIDTTRLFLGNGSDEAIDLLFRAFAEPGRDSVVIMPPTYGVYKVFANLNDVSVISVPLTETYQMDLSALESLIRDTDHPERLKLLFICSPNNPTGNCMPREQIIRALDIFPGIVVVDQAYQDFAETPGVEDLLETYEHLVILRTLSKAWGLANARLGMACSSPAIAQVFANIKYPYNISGPAQRVALRALRHREAVREGVAAIVASRHELVKALGTLSYVEHIYPSDANFILVRIKDTDSGSEADSVYELLKAQGIIIRNRDKEPGCAGCVRITVGSAEENASLISAMRTLEDKV